MSFYTGDIISSKSEAGKKLVIVITMSAILVGVLLPSARLSYSQTIEEGEEAEQLDQAQQEQEVSIAEITTPIDSFTARGDIGSLVFAVNETEERETTTMQSPSSEQLEDSMTTTTTDDIDPSLPVTIPAAIRPPFILTGDWELRTDNGTATMFNVGFTMVRTDGTNYHTIDLTNFRGTDEGPVTLGPTTERINGTVDVFANGTMLHESEEITITLGGLVLGIHFNEGDARDHFKGLPIFGTIRSIVSGDGTTIVGVTESEDILVDEPPAAPTSEGTTTEEQPAIEQGFTGDPTSPFQPYEGQPVERGLLAPKGPFDPVHPEEGNGVLEALRNPFGL
jgi:type II secretory pathway pseudopilin PulG